MLWLFLAAMIASTTATTTPPAVALAGDAVKGKTLFAQQCATCHALDPKVRRIGPHLVGVIGRKAGTIEGFSYSTGLRNAGWVWDAARLDPYLANPRKVVTGSTMTMSVPNAQRRADIIAYMATVTKAP